jgi:hypothetical protein
MVLRRLADLGWNFPTRTTAAHAQLAGLLGGLELNKDQNLCPKQAAAFVVSVKEIKG